MCSEGLVTKCLRVRDREKYHQELYLNLNMWSSCFQNKKESTSFVAACFKCVPWFIVSLSVSVCRGCGCEINRGQQEVIRLIAALIHPA